MKFGKNLRELRMKLGISNIAWPSEWDFEVYQEMQRLKINGLEIAPSKIFGERPYDNLKTAKVYIENLKRKYNLSIPSMQSILYGINENIFADNRDRYFLINYTKKAIDFANEIFCKNLVFGCPRNRNGYSVKKNDVAQSFFQEIGDYAAVRNLRIGIEAVPKLYKTDFLNTTGEAIKFVRKINSKGIGLNFDLGALIINGENISVIKDNIDIISHVHISEPGLEKIKRRKIHTDLKNTFNAVGYDGYFSVEMKKQDRLQDITEVLEYICEIFA